MRIARFGLVIVLGLLFAACGAARLAGDALSIRPSGNIVTETRAVSAFHSVDLRAFGDVEIVQGDPQTLTVEGSDNVVSHIVTSVQRGVLLIETDVNINVLGAGDKAVLTFRITMPEVRALTLSGAGAIHMDALAAGDVDLTVTGAGNIAIDALTADNLGISVQGMGDVVVAGRAQRAQIELPGAGNVRAPDLEIGQAEVTIAGMGDAELWVAERLSGKIAGAGSVSYYGTPATDTSVTGVGSWRALGAKSRDM